MVKIGKSAIPPLEGPGRLKGNAWKLWNSEKSLFFFVSLHTIVVACPARPKAKGQLKEFMKKSKLNLFVNSGISPLPHVVSRAESLVNSLQTGEVPEALRTKLLNLNRNAQPGGRIASLAQNLLDALYAAARGHYSDFPEQFKSDAAYVLAYFWEEVDLTPDRQEMGLLDDCRHLVIASDFYKIELSAFLLRAARPKIAMEWEEKAE